MTNSDTYFLVIIASGINATVAERVEEPYEERLDEIIIQPESFLVHTPHHIVITKFQGWKYLSCYRVDYLDFFIYFSPFQMPVWICIAVALFIATFTNDVASYFKFHVYNNSSLFFFVGCIVDEFSNICTYSSTRMLILQIYCNSVAHMWNHP